MDNTNRKQYWEEYVTYWENKVNEANKNINAHDKTNDDKILRVYFELLNIRKNDMFLDFGCGSCRLFPLYKEIVGTDAKKYFGCDIAKKPLEHARILYPELMQERILSDYDGEKLPYDAGLFDRIICFGVFDACNQERIISELLRILKKGGKLLITGKNDFYHAEDNEALVAEINARKKEHPNYFTNTNVLKKQLEEKGCAIEVERLFERRGDFPKNVYKYPLEKFYEWVYVIRKGKEIMEPEFNTFSDRFSKTYRLLPKEEINHYEG